MKKLIRIVIILLLIIVLVPLAVLYFRPDLTLSKEQAKKELSIPASHFITWRGAELHYTNEGNFDGLPLMMIHGFGGSYRNFDSLTALMKGEYHIYRIDLPGFGLSDFPEVKEGENFIQDYCDYLTFILDTLHLDSLYVVGNSLGGGMAWIMAGDHPDKVRKLVLLDAAGYDTKNISGKLAMFKFKSVSKVFNKGMPLFMSWKGMERGYADNTKIDEAVVKLNNKFTNRKGNIPHMLTLARAQQFPDSTLIQRVECPTLIVWGQEDSIIPVTDADRFHRDIKNSEVVIIDPCGHMPMMEMPEKTQEVMEKFFKE